MREEYQFSDSESTANPFADRIREKGFSVTRTTADGATDTRYFPPGTMPSTAATVHVYPSSNGWAVRTEGASRAFRRSPSEAEATAIGISLARKTGADLVVHFQRPRTTRKPRVA